MNFLRNLISNEEGQTFAEYGLILALVGIVLVTALGIFSGALDTLFRTVAGHF